MAGNTRVEHLMKRHPALVRLSWDHHHGLALARRIAAEAPGAEAGALAALYGDVLAAWSAALLPHFRAEQECLLARLIRHVDRGHPAVTRTLEEHTAIESLIAAMRDSADLEARRAALVQFGTKLREHIRWEEAELFELAQSAAGPEMDAIGADLASQLPAFSETLRKGQGWRPGAGVPWRAASSILPGMAVGRFRALAFDLDGTLLTSAEEVSPRNLAALRAARAAGYEIIVASARWRQLAERVAAEVDAAQPLVACSGAEVWHRTLRHDLLDLRLPEAFAAALYGICDAHRCIATVVLDDEVVVRMEGEPDRSQMPAEMRPAKSLRLEASHHPRIALIQGTDVNRVIRDELAGEWAGAVRFVESISSRGKSILTLTAAGADKGAALAVACAHLDIPLDEVVSFGDAENDLEMFRVTGASVAMGQAAGHVRAQATFTTASNAEDGVAVAVERLLREGSLGRK